MSTYQEQAEQAAAAWDPFTQNHDPSFWRCLRQAYAEGFAAGLFRANGEEDPFESAEYAKFVESMLPHCHCAKNQPCDGVLAGGVCDDIQDDQRDDEDLRDEEDREGGQYY